MENFASLFQGFATAVTFENMLATLAGCIMGIIVGAMPGIGSLAGCSLLLPLTFHMNPTTGIIMLAGIFAIIYDVLMFRQHRTKRHLLYAFCLLVILLIELLEKR